MKSSFSSKVPQVQIIPCFTLLLSISLSITIPATRAQSSTTLGPDGKEYGQDHPYKQQKPQHPPEGYGHIKLGQDANGDDEEYVDPQLRGDSEDLTPLHPSHWIFTPPRQKFVHPVPEKEYKQYQPRKGETGDLSKAVAGQDLTVQETRHRPQRQSYSRNYNPKPKHYRSENRHSDGGQGKGGYHKSDSHNGKKGYSSYSSYDRAHKDQYGDSDHKQYRHQDGDKKSGGYSSGHGDSDGGHSFYGIDDGNSYTSAGDHGEEY